MICILGGSGFIGTRLARRFSRSGRQFVVVDKAPSSAFPDHAFLADVRSLDALRRAVPDSQVLIHLAAEHHDDVRPLKLYHEVNVGGARNACTVARERNIRCIVFTSSVAVYGFARDGTDEFGDIAPFGEYGRSKYDAELVFKAWYEEAPHERCLAIIRPTVVFGEGNRGNVYRLLRQIASRRFLMVGHGNVRKSMAYVENLAAFIEHALGFGPGLYTYNYVDHPDFTMNHLVATVNGILGRPAGARFRLPFSVAVIIGTMFDLLSTITRRRYAVSAMRVRKFCADSVYRSAIDQAGFVPPVPLRAALEDTVRYEFLRSRDGVDRRAAE